jgi:hypothetical protein
MGPYLVLFRLRSLELHPLGVEVHCKGHPPGQSCPHFYPKGLPRLQHYFPVGTFRQVSVSEPSSWPQPTKNLETGVNPLRFTSLHADAMKGVFRYDITVQFVPQPGGAYTASLDVVTVGVHVDDAKS